MKTKEVTLTGGSYNADLLKFMEEFFQTEEDFSQVTINCSLGTVKWKKNPVEKVLIQQIRTNVKAVYLGFFTADKTKSYWGLLTTDQVYELLQYTDEAEESFFDHLFRMFP